MESCIQREKERREADERDIRRSMRENEIANFIPSLTTMPSWMNRVDIFQLPTIQEIVQQNDYNIPITPADWDLAMPRILQEIDSYAGDIQEKLIAYITTTPVEKSSSLKSTPSLGDDLIAILNSPTTFFRCQCCLGSLLRYPALLSHNNHSSTKTVVSQRLRFDTDATNIARALSGVLDSLTGNISEGKFECLRCKEHSTPPLSWDELVSFILTIPLLTRYDTFQVYHFVVKQYEYCKANAKWHINKPHHDTEDLYDDHALTGSTPVALLTRNQAEVLSSKTAGRKLVRIRLPF